MKTRTSSLMDSHLVDFSNSNANNIKSNSTQLPQQEISDEEIFNQAIKAITEMYGEMYGNGYSAEIDAYFRGAKWMKKQFKGGEDA